MKLIGAYSYDGLILSEVFGAWAGMDPEAALKRIDQLPGLQRVGLRKHVLEIVRKNDPERALALARSSSADPVAQINEEAAILEGLIGDDPIKATAQVFAMPLGKKRYETLLQLARARAGIDPEETLAWGKTLPEGSEKQAVIATALSFTKPNLDEVVSLLDELGWHYAGANPQDVEEIQSDTDGRMTHESSSGSLVGALEKALAKVEGMDDLPDMLHALSSMPPDDNRLLQSLLVNVGSRPARINSGINRTRATFESLSRDRHFKRQVA